jgi:hypothetical protein
MPIQEIFEAIEAEHKARRERAGGVLLVRDPTDRIAEVTKHLGDAWPGSELRAQMVKVAATAIEAIEQHDLSTAEQAAFYASVDK